MFPQGRVLGVLLFNIKVNSLYTFIDRKSTVVQYADDTGAFNASKYLQSMELNSNCICDFFGEHQMLLNVDKTEFITFQTTNKNDE